MTLPKEVDVAFMAAQEANWLALLRLNEPRSVIRAVFADWMICAGEPRTWSQLSYEMRPCGGGSHALFSRDSLECLANLLPNQNNACLVETFAKSLDLAETFGGWCGIA